MAGLAPSRVLKTRKLDVGDQIDELDKRVTETQRRYEMYFMGIERAEPRWFRDDCKRRIAELNHTYFTNTGLKYKFQGIKARLTTFENYWNRTLKQIEEGTYRKHKIMADRHMKQREAERQAKEASGEGNGAAAQKPLSPDSAQARRQRLAKGGTAVTVTGSAIDDAAVERVHKALAKVKAAAGDATPVMDRAKLAQGLRDSLPKLREKYGDRPLDIKILNRDGKVVVRAVPRGE